jgi:hypothetical protein
LALTGLFIHSPPYYFLNNTIIQRFSSKNKGVSGGLFEGTKYLDLGARGDRGDIDRIVFGRSYWAYSQPKQRSKNIFYLQFHFLRPGLSSSALFGLERF